jgi:hypothetical protein
MVPAAEQPADDPHPCEHSKHHGIPYRGIPAVKQEPRHGVDLLGGGQERTPANPQPFGVLRRPTKEHSVNTRTLAIAAFVIAVIVLLLLLL